MWLSFLQTKSNNKTYEKTIDISNLTYMYMYVTTSSMGLLNRQSIHDNIQWFHSPYTDQASWQESWYQ